MNWIELSYASLILIYIIYVYTLLISRKERNWKDLYKPFSVIIPCYNEEHDYLIQCVESAVNAKGIKQIILVNNNSNLSGTIQAINEIEKKFPEILIVNEKRQGKRFAHSKGLEFSKHDLIVFIDSDTIVDKNAFLELIKPFQDENVGAVAGQVKLANKKENLLTRSISAMFWTSSNIFRKSSSSIGYMQVIAGCLSAYRKNLLLKLEPDYLNQKFLGRPCAISDDRFLTQRIQTRFKKKIEYQESSICWTFMPGNPIKFWKTLERWRRGVLRETFLIWKEPVKNAKLMVFDMEFNFLILTIMIFLKIWFIVHFVLNFSFINLIFFLCWFLLMASLYSSYMIAYNPKEFPAKVLYSFLYEFFFVFTYFHAWFNIRKQGKWMTR